MDDPPFLYCLFKFWAIGTGSPKASYPPRKENSLENYTVYHHKPIDGYLLKRLEEANRLLIKSELYDPTFRLDLCLNDGSSYSSIVEMTHGQSFGVGFANKVSLQGTADYRENTVELNGYKWNLTQLLVHESIHCLQFHALGLLKSNPIGNIPRWKNEGYPEYIARQGSDQLDLAQNIERLLHAEKEDINGWDIKFKDNTSVSRQYYRYWLLAQYCMDIKNMSYAQILSDNTDEDAIQKDMTAWYKRGASADQQ